MSQPAFDFDLDDGGVPTYSVSELGEAINGALRRRFDDGVWVRGEIQGWSERGQHAYFRLVEVADDGSKAVLNVQFFAPARNRLRSMLLKHRLQLGDGVKVRIFGALDFYAAGGQLGLKMTGIDPRFTLGEMALQRDDVLRRLKESGLLERNRTRPLAVAPLRVGVVTSADSAAWADFLHEIERSGLAFVLRLVDVHVQGEWAVTEVTNAVRTLSRHADLDVVVIIRGGGSRTELATFDAEAIATAIATCRLPVFTGLGHEIDRSIADEVAHAALKTPTACAAALVERVEAYRVRTEAAFTGICHRAERALVVGNSAITEVAGGLRHRVLAAVDRSDTRLTDRARRTAEGARRATDRATTRVERASAAVARQPQRLEYETRALDGIAERLRLLDPATTMARGWSITRAADGRVVRAATEIAAGDTIVTTFAAGSARSTVEETQP